MKPQKKRRNGAGWNKGKVQGKKSHFEEDECLWLSDVFLHEENWHDLALFSVALDTMLRADDLLSLKVEDVCFSNGQIRNELDERQEKTERPVYPALARPTQEALAYWIRVSGKRRGEYLFTRTKKERDAKPISRNHLSRIVKRWAEWLGRPPEKYACHSLRRTKGLLLYRQGHRVADISRMFGHASEASTMEYLGIDQERVSKISRDCVLTVPFKPDRMRCHQNLRPRPLHAEPVQKRDPALHCPNAVYSMRL